MEKFVKICEILTDTEEDTQKIFETLKDSKYSVCVNGDWGSDGTDIYVMEYVGEVI